MTTDEMISNLQSLLGKIGTVLDTQILVELKLAQRQAERGPLLPWFLITQAYASTTASEPRVAVPSDFLRETESSDLYYVDSDSGFTRLQKRELDILRETYEGEDGGVPKFYSILGTYYWVYPVPDGAYRIQMNYAASDTVLATGDSGNLWSLHYPDLLMGLAGQNLCLHWRALEIKPRFDEMVVVAREQMVIDNTAREMANMERSFGE